MRSVLRHVYSEDLRFKILPWIYFCLNPFSSRYHFACFSVQKTVTKVDRQLDKPSLPMKHFLSVLPQLHNVLHCRYPFCFWSYLKTLCYVRCCGGTEHIMLRTTAIPFCRNLYSAVFIFFFSRCELASWISLLWLLRFVTVCKSWMLLCSVTLHGYYSLPSVIVRWKYCKMHVQSQKQVTH